MCKAGLLIESRGAASVYLVSAQGGANILEGAARGFFSTSGLGSYQRDLLAILALPPGSRYRARWGSRYVSSSLEAIQDLLGATSLFCLSSSSERRLLPLRLVRVIDAEIVSPKVGRDEPFVRVQFRMGHWLEECQVPQYSDLVNQFPIADRSEHCKVIPEMSTPFRATPDTQAWVATVAALKELPGYQNMVYATVTHIERRRRRGAHKAQLLSSVADDLDLAGPELVHRLLPRELGGKGETVLRSGRVYSLGVIYYALRLKDINSGGKEGAKVLMELGIREPDYCISQIGPDELLHPGVFERLDLAFSVRATRQRHTAIDISINPVPGSAEVPAPEISLEVELRPRLGLRLALTAALALAAAALATSALSAPDSVFRDIAPVISSAMIATLVAFALRPEDS